MGYYFYFKTKEIAIRKDAPQNIIDFLNERINNKNYDYPAPEHPLFKLERWDSLFGHWDWLNPPSFVFKDGYWRLSLECEVKYGWEEIQAFSDWITPYVAGRKKNEYIGWYKGESHEIGRINLYIKR
jgi:hypothetical protein